MNFKLKTLAVCLMWTLAPGCGDSGQDDTSSTTTQATPGTTGPSSATESTPTESTPTEGTSTESTLTDSSATDTEDPPTSGTTDGPSDPEIKALCDESFANGKKLLEAQCQCQVDLDFYPDLATCLAEQESDPALDTCTCEVYSQFPELKESLECIGPAQTTATMCAGGVMCTEDPTPLFDCLDPYYEALDTCASPSVNVIGQVEIQCKGATPFLCTSGEEIPDFWKCDYEVQCPDASDEMGCPNSFMCADGMGYVPGNYKCDGYPDCADASDEAGCPTFMCMNGTQIPEVFKCNGSPDCCEGDPDCPDTSDEEGCPTFMCMDGEMIPLPYQCDGFPDCMDGSDEVDCPTFMCGSGEEIPLQFKCDGGPDCEDGSDEADCP